MDNVQHLLREKAKPLMPKVFILDLNSLFEKFIMNQLKIMCYDMSEFIFEHF